MMTSDELRDWRNKHNYTQALLIEELGLKSRQSIINWEKGAQEIPRTVELSLLYLEKYPEYRKCAGKRLGADLVRKQRSLGRAIERGET